MALITSGLWFESFNQVHSKLFKTQSSLREFFVEADADKSGQVLTVRPRLPLPWHRYQQASSCRCCCTPLLKLLPRALIRPDGLEPHCVSSHPTAAVS